MVEKSGVKRPCLFTPEGFGLRPVTGLHWHPYLDPRFRRAYNEACGLPCTSNLRLLTYTSDTLGLIFVLGFGLNTLLVESRGVVV